MNNGFNPLGMFEDPSPYINRDHFDLSPYNTSMPHFMHWNGILWSLPVEGIS